MPLLWLSVAFLSGLVLGARAGQLRALWIALTLIAAALAVLETRPFAARWALRRKRFIPLPLGLLAAFFFLGALRYLPPPAAPTPADLAWYNDRGAVTLTGVVTGPPERSGQSVGFVVRVEAVDGRAVSGLARVRAAGSVDLQYGDRVSLTGVPRTPAVDGDFSYRDYLAQRGIFTLLNNPRIEPVESGRVTLLRAVYALRERAAAGLKAALPMPESALLSGILLGLDGGIPAGVKRAFQDTGTAHIIAISGFNIAIVAGLFFSLFRRLLSRWWALLLAVLALAFYTVLVGGAPPVTRAALMGSIGLLGNQLGRRSSGANALTFTAALMSAFNPHLLWDVGFQLSFCATLGLVLFGDGLQRGLNGWLEQRLPPVWAARVAGPLGEYFLLTLAAQFMTLPIIVLHFERVSFSSLLANPLVLPAQPALMITGGLAVLAGLVVPVAGQVLAVLAWPLAAYTIRVVEALAVLPGGAVDVAGLSPLWVAAFYALVLLAWRFRARLARYRLRPVLALMTLLLLCGVAWRTAADLPDGRLHVRTLSGGSQPALLVQTPGGRRVMIAAGGAWIERAGLLARELPFGDARLDALVVPPGEASSLQGLPDILRLPGKAFVVPPMAQGRAADLLAEWLRQGGVPEQDWLPGAVLQLDDGARLMLLAANAKGAAFLLEWENLSVLLPGGLPRGQVEAALGGRSAQFILWSVEDAAQWPGADSLAAGGGLHLDCTKQACRIARLP